MRRMSPPRGVISAAPLQCARKVLGYGGSGAATPSCTDWPPRWAFGTFRPDEKYMSGLLLPHNRPPKKIKPGLLLPYNRTPKKIKPGLLSPHKTDQSSSKHHRIQRMHRALKTSTNQGSRLKSVRIFQFNCAAHQKWHGYPTRSVGIHAVFYSKKVF